MIWAGGKVGNMIWGFGRKQYNPDDPVQLALLDRLGEAAVAELTVTGLDDASASVGLLILGENWSAKEARQRLDAVLDSVKPHLEPAIYERAKLVAARAIKNAFD